MNKKANKEPLKRTEKELNIVREIFDLGEDKDTPLYGMNENDALEFMINQEPKVYALGEKHEWSEWDHVPFGSFLIFFHWYERRHKQEIIFSKKIIERLWPKRRNNLDHIENIIEHTIWEKEISTLHSKRFPGFSKLYEFYFDLLPNIEQFTFKELKGYPFAKYLIDLFPNITKLDFRNDESGVQGLLSFYSPEMIQKGLERVKKLKKKGLDATITN